MRHINYDPHAMEKRQVIYWKGLVQPPKPTLKEKVWTAIMYTSVVVGVGVAAFYVTPVHAAGSQANTPSIIYMGEKAKFQMRVDNNKADNATRLERLKSENQLQLEEAKSLHARQLEEDKAYHDRLKDQRKGKCTYC